MPSKRVSSRTSRPNLRFEKAENGRICGVDEAGRGPLAGPVVAAAVILCPNTKVYGLNDSKLLSQDQRERLLNAILSVCDVGIGIAEPQEIDARNILQASMLAMQRAVSELSVSPDVALIDGNRAPDIPCKTVTIIKGDSKSRSIAAASIVAKVTRDRLMQMADARYPQYGFSKHKGYPTQFHRERLAKIGPCPIHRYSYAPVKQAWLY